MLYFFDTEFIEDGATIDLISIGIVSADGRELYQCNRDAKLAHADEWVIFNVFPYLPIFHARESGWRWNEPDREAGKTWPPDQVAVSRYEIRDRILKFIGEDKQPEFWAWYASYDWVAFCQLWGRMMDLPAHFPKYCRDLKQAVDHTRSSRVVSQTGGKHNALEDARWVKETFRANFP